MHILESAYITVVFSKKEEAWYLIKIRAWTNRKSGDTMIKCEDIHRYIKTGESQYVEFKRAEHKFPKSALETICICSNGRQQFGCLFYFHFFCSTMKYAIIRDGINLRNCL